MGSTFAANDCNIIVWSGVEAIVSIYGKRGYTNVLPTEAFQQAVINLKAYCCSKGDLVECSEKEKDNVSKWLYPESEFFFDHLFDVAMRRLDGVTGLAYNLTPDPTGLERRTKITEIAKSATGTQAREIEGLYTGYRTLHKYTWDILINGYNKNIATVSLGDKYNTICGLMKDIYDKIVNTNKIVLWNNFLNRCENIVKERTKRENGYTKILMVQKSNQLLDEGIKAYTKKYYVQEKLMTLWNLITKVKDMFKTIVQQAPVGQTCSK